MNKISPPILILLDVVFVVLFALALQPEKMELVINFPEDIIKMNDVEIVKIDSNYKIISFYNKAQKQWINDQLSVSLFEKYITGLKTLNFKKSKIKGLKTDDKMYIEVHSHIYSNIGRELLSRCSSVKDSCYGKFELFLNIIMPLKSKTTIQ